ncbi:MAG: protease complex subunit PrcB family protein [Candidatus Micrarchaeota archaeon]|nr:protease complex subunit PrcB family protein [Candidatus Micrarchaeota archaeon]
MSFTGGYGLKVNEISREDNTFLVDVTYLNPSAGPVAQAFTQPAAVIPLGELEPGDYRVEVHIGERKVAVNFSVV